MSTPAALGALLQAGRGRAAAALIADDVRAAIAAAFGEVLTPEMGVVVVGTGGLARRELTPKADVDLWVLVPSDADDPLLARVQDGLRSLWDRGLALGHAVRTAPEASAFARGDHVAATALLEATPVFGDEALAHRTLIQLHQEVLGPQRPALIDAKLGELMGRRARFGGASHLVEPDLKRSPGGLRDVHGLLWIGLLTSPWRREDIGRGRSALAHLLETGRLTSAEVAEVGEALDALLVVRIALHQAANRREDRLLVEHQPAIAASLGIVAEGEETPSEALMRRVVRASRQVRYVLDAALFRMLEGEALTRWERAHCLTDAPRPPGPRVVGRGFRARGLTIYTDDPAAFDDDPSRVLDLFRLAAEHDLTPTPRSLSRARVALEGRTDLWDDQGVGQALLRLCRSTAVVGTPFMAMLEAGVVGAILKDLYRLEARFKHDGYHAYTTDAHICRCTDLALQVASGAVPAPAPLASALRRTSRFHLFVLGALFHDIAKGLGGDHSEVGVDIARREAERMGLPPGEADLLAFLVKEHLVLSRVSQRRDLSDPAVIEEVAGTVRTVERLDLLALLTFVDIASVAPGMLNDWKARLLGLAVDRVAEYLRDPASASVRSVEEEAVRASARARLGPLAPAAIVDRFVDGASVRSLGARFSKSLERDLEVYAAFVAAGETVAVDARHTEGGRAHTLRVACVARARVIADVAGALSAHGANVLHAHADMRDDGVALCAFRIDDRGAALDPTALELTRQGVLDVVTGRAPPPPVMAARAPRGPPLPAHVRVLDGVDSWGAAIVEVRGADRPGLLAALLGIIAGHGLKVCLAKVSTEGSRVRDAFFLTDGDNQPPPRERLAALAEGLGRVVDLERALVEV